MAKSADFDTSVKTGNTLTTPNAAFHVACPITAPRLWNALRDDCIDQRFLAHSNWLLARLGLDLRIRFRIAMRDWSMP